MKECQYKIAVNFKGAICTQLDQWCFGTQSLISRETDAALDTTVVTAVVALLALLALMVYSWCNISPESESGLFPITMFFLQTLAILKD